MTGPVDSLAAFMDWVKNSTVQPQEKHISFYRGHDDETYELMPSVYRVIDNRSYRKVEYQLYQDMLTRNPEAFAEDKTIFDRLVRMQHHGLPTRLLDITQSPLIALFFACQKPDDQKNGEVIFFIRKQSQIIYPSAIPEITLAWLEVTENYLSEMTCKITNEFESLFTTLDILTNPDSPDQKNTRDFLLQCRDQIESIKNTTDLQNIFRLIRDIERGTESLFPQRGYPYPLNNKSKFEKKFEKVIKRIIANQSEQMSISSNHNWQSIHSFLREFTKFYFVYPPLNNERIRRQQGAFIIFPSVQTEESPLNCVKVTVDGNKKKGILTELEKLGFTRSYLFPELEEQAKDICSRYQSQ